MSRYRARCEWDGYNWVATIDGMLGAVTQAKRLDLIASRLVEVVKLISGKVISPEDITLIPHIDDEIDHAAEEIAELETSLHEVDAVLAERRRRVVQELRRRGFPLRDIGVIAHVSHQRVHQLLAEAG
jgi:DNA-directed RNA polymerase specialized sigma subunit